MAFLLNPIKFISSESSDVSKLNCNRFLTRRFEAKGNANHLSVSGADIKQFYEQLVFSATSDNFQLNKNEQQSFNGSDNFQSDCLTHKELTALPLISKNITDFQRNSWKHKLFFAASYCDFDLLIKAYSFVGDIDSRDDFGWTPLMCAVFAGHFKMVKYLLENGANPNFANAKGQRSLDLAVNNRFFNIASLLNSFELKNQLKTCCHGKGNGIAKNKIDYCNSCDANYSDGHRHHSSIIHNYKTDSIQRDSSYFAIPSTNRGFQLLIKEGWNEESGLGINESGKKYPLKTVLKLDRIGLGGNLHRSGVSKPVARITHFGPNDISAIQLDRSALVSGKTRKRNEFARKNRREKHWIRNFRRDFY